MSSLQTPVFEALIVPHRSLTPQGIKVVVGLLLLFSALIALRFWLWGAWPVAICSFVDVPVLVLLFTINRRRARASELIMLSSQELTVIRTDASGRRLQDSLPVAWLRIDLDATKGIPRVLFSSRGRDCEVGAFLHEPERLSLFSALSDALHGLHNPRFDNPQLRAD